MSPFRKLTALLSLSATTAFLPHPHSRPTLLPHAATAKSDPMAQDALERTAAHLQKLRQQSSRPVRSDGPPDPLGEERDRRSHERQVRTVAADGRGDDPDDAREHRRALFHRMAAEGFVVYRGEWWHFEWGTRRWAGVRGAQPIYGPATPTASPTGA